MKIYIDSEGILTLGTNKLSISTKIRYNNISGNIVDFLTPNGVSIIGRPLDIDTDVVENNIGVRYTSANQLWEEIKPFFVDALTMGALDDRLINLENNETIYQLYEYVGTSSTGQITIPEESSIFDMYGDGVLDAIVVQADANQKPTATLSVNSFGAIVQVSSLSATGTYVLNSTPTVNSCIIYYVLIKELYESNIPTANVISSEKRSTTFDYTDFVSGNVNPAYKEGRLFYNNTEHSLSYYNNSSDMTLNIGQESVVYAVNKSGGALQNGQAVYISGAQLNRPKLSLAIANDFSKSFNTLGLVTETSIPLNGMGYVTTQGLVNGINTSAFTEGDILWLSETTPGGLTNIEPTHDYCKVRIGYCVVSHNTNGKILVNVITNKHKFGNIAANNYSYFEDDGTLVAKGNAITYRDELPSVLIPVAGAAAPDLVAHTIGGVARALYGFDGVNTQEILSGSIEIPHDYAYGLPIEMHIHWRPSTTGTGVVKWFIDWEYSPSQGAPITQTPLTVLATLDTNKQYWHLLHSFGYLPDVGFALGGKIGFNLRRTPSGAQDTYAGDALFEQVAIHIPCDTLGSRQVYIK